MTGAPVVAWALAVMVAVMLVSDAPVAIAFLSASVTAAHDDAARRLPDAWVAATAVLAALAVLAEHGVAATGPAVACSAIIGGGLLVGHLASPNAVGFGDVKFAAALAPALVAGTTVDAGPAIALLAVTWMCAASAIAIGHAAVARRSTVAFGPSLVLGAGLTLVIASGAIS